MGWGRHIEIAGVFGRLRQGLFEWGEGEDCVRRAGGTETRRGFLVAEQVEPCSRVEAPGPDQKTFGAGTAQVLVTEDRLIGVGA